MGKPNIEISSVSSRVYFLLVPLTLQLELSLTRLAWLLDITRERYAAVPFQCDLKMTAENETVTNRQYMYMRQR